MSTAPRNKALLLAGLSALATVALGAVALRACGPDMLRSDAERNARPIPRLSPGLPALPDWGRLQCYEPGGQRGPSQPVGPAMTFGCEWDGDFHCPDRCELTYEHRWRGYTNSIIVTRDRPAFIWRQHLYRYRQLPR